MAKFSWLTVGLANKAISEAAQLADIYFDHRDFGGGLEANGALQRLGFKIFDRRSNNYVGANANGTVQTKAPRNGHPTKQIALQLDDYRRISNLKGQEPISHIDAEAYRQALERRTNRHRTLLNAINSTARRVGLSRQQNRYLDLVIDHKILIEAKTLDKDDMKQVRTAIGQLHVYQHLHSELLQNTHLFAVFDRKPKIAGIAVAKCLAGANIHLAWQNGKSFEGTRSARRLAAWLFR